MVNKLRAFARSATYVITILVAWTFFLLSIHLVESLSSPPARSVFDTTPHRIATKAIARAFEEYNK